MVSWTQVPRIAGAAVDDATEALIVGLYDAALDPARWGACFADIRRAMGSHSSMSSLLHPASGTVHVLACNAPEPFVRGYLETWWPKDLWMIEASRRAGRIVVGSEMVPDEQFRRSEVYNELVRPTSDVRDVLGTVFDIGGWRMVIGLHRPDVGTYGTTEKGRLGRLLPHVMRSLEVTLRFEELGRLGEAGQAALDALGYGVIVVDRLCRPVLVNRVAGEILTRGDGLVWGVGPATGGRPLSALRPQDAERLHALVQGATMVPPEAGGALRVRRSDERPPYAVLVSPAPGRRSVVLNHDGPTAILAIQDPGRLPVPPARILRDLYGLTPAEADIVLQLGSGSSPDEVAAVRDVSITTLRSQIRTIFAKTDAVRLTDLARITAALPQLEE